MENHMEDPSCVSYDTSSVSHDTSLSHAIDASDIQPKIEKESRFEDSYSFNCSSNMTDQSGSCYESAVEYPDPMNDPTSPYTVSNLDTRHSSSPGEHYQSPSGPELQPLPLNFQTLGPIFPSMPIGPFFPQPFGPSVPNNGPDNAGLDNYCNYLQSFFKPLEAFGNLFNGNLPQRPVSPIAEDDYTIQDLSSKPPPVYSPRPPTCNSDNSYVQTPGSLANGTNAPLAQSNMGFMVPSDAVADSPQKANLGYMCDICKEGFKSAKGLSCHRASIHAEGASLFACKVCSKKFNTPGHLSRHEERHFQKINMTCFLCDSHFKSINNLKFHLFSIHILSMDHSGVFDVKMDPDLEPILFDTTFIRTEMEGSLNDDDVKLHVRGPLTNHIKLYQSHFNSVVDSTPFVQVIFHKTCCKIMTVSRISSSQFTLTMVPQTQVISESKLVKREGKVVGFEVAVIAKLCMFMINKEPMILMKDGTSSVTISIWDVKIIN